MGFIFSKIWSKLRGDREYKIVLVGLANAGKTTILYKMSLGEVVSAHPTIGSNVEEVKHANTRLQVWDLGGQESLRNSWSLYFTSADAMIFVVDSTDSENTVLAKMELFNLLVHPDLREVPILVLANKVDLEEAMSSEQISEILNLPAIKEHEWFLQRCSAMTGEGLAEGLD